MNFLSEELKEKSNEGHRAAEEKGGKEKEFWFGFVAIFK